MAKNLVIVESPAKAKTIEKFLWADYKVVASMGHIRDLPSKTLWVNIEKNFEPEYEITDAKKKHVTELQRLAKTSKEIWIATDEDREWEAIGWHLCHTLWLDPVNVKRIVFHEITKKAIEEAIKNPRNVDINLVDAQQARRILDRLVGYKVSPILWKKIKKWLSAGRVQSVAVKMIVEKELEIKNFKPKESWKVSAILEDKNTKVKVTLAKVDGKVKNFTSEEDVIKFFHTLGNGEQKKAEDKNGNKIITLKEPLDFTLNDIVKKESKRSPQAPFTTSTLQQEASRKFGYGVKQTMMIAQKLYEWIELWNGERQGLITYMRTDSVNLSDEARKKAGEMILKNYGKEYHTPRNYKTKSAGAQEAHEAIRPVDFNRTPESVSSHLEPQERKLYELIWKRALASQMSEAIVETTNFSFSPQDKDQSWSVNGEVIQFDGFMKLYIESLDDEENETEDGGILPNLKKWDILQAREINANQTFSRPPARYTEASLVKKMESEWIGRPSTYAPTISTIIDRGYIEKFDKKYLIPTDIAYVVTEFLGKYFEKMMDYKFTSIVEEDFDKVAAWEESYVTMLDRFWNGSLKKDLDTAWTESEKVVQLVWKDCPKCGKDLVFKYSKTGKFIGCSGYPECDFIDQPEDSKDALQALKDRFEGKPCPDGVEGTIVVKTGRFWPFLASSKYPEVKWIGKIKSEKDELLEIILKEKWLLIDAESGEELVVKWSRRWPFLAAKNYPEVKIAKNIPKDVWDELNKRMKKDEEETTVEE